MANGDFYTTLSIISKLLFSDERVNQMQLIEIGMILRRIEINLFIIKISISYRNDCNYSLFLHKFETLKMSDAICFIAICS